MKSKRFLLINIVVLALNILLISLSVIRLPGSSCCFGQSYGFHPVKIEAPHFSYVGQLRFFLKMARSFGADYGAGKPLNWSFVA